MSTGKCVTCHVAWNAARVQQEREAKLRAQGVNVDELKRTVIEAAAAEGYDLTTPEGQAQLSKAVKNKERAEARAERRADESREEKRERRRAEAEATRANPNSVRPPWERPA